MVKNKLINAKNQIKNFYYINNYFLNSFYYNLYILILNLYNCN